jgi:LemA protein
MDPLLIGVLVLVVIVVLWAIATYNKFVVLRNNIENAWAQIDVQLKRRFDLIPNLVETIKGYAKHEKEIFSEVTKNRAGLMSGTPAQRAEADNLLTASLGKLIAVAENYPKLQANENFMKLQEELSGTEDKISFVRTSYNDNVLQYNNMTQQFPSSLLAGMLGFLKKEFFNIPEVQREAVKVKF